MFCIRLIAMLIFAGIHSFGFPQENAPQKHYIPTGTGFAFITAPDESTTPNKLVGTWGAKFGEAIDTTDISLSFIQSLGKDQHYTFSVGKNEATSLSVQGRMRFIEMKGYLFAFIQLTPQLNKSDHVAQFYMGCSDCCWNLLAFRLTDNKLIVYAVDFDKAKKLLDKPRRDFFHIVHRPGYLMHAQGVALDKFFSDLVDQDALFLWVELTRATSGK